MLSSKPTDLSVSERMDSEESHVSKGRSLLKSALLCAALGISSCATPNASAPHGSEKMGFGVDAGNTADRGRGGSKSNEAGELEERMREKCEEEGYLTPIDCNLDTDPSDPDRAKVQFRALFI